MKLQLDFLNWWRKNKGDFDGILFDIDGTLTSGCRTLPGADVLLETLEKENFPYLLLTNDGNHSVQEKSALMRKAGLEINPDKIVSCGMALSLFVEKEKCADAKYYVMGELGTPCYAELAGLRTTRKPSDIDGCKGVIVGEGDYDWQKNFSAVFNFFVKNPGAKLLVPNPDSYWPSGKNGELGIGAGGKARFICSILSEYGHSIKPIYFGKPYRPTFDFALRKMRGDYGFNGKIRRKRIIMMGDSLRSDIKGGNSIGLTTALVTTGITTPKHLSESKGRFVPTLVFSSIG